MLRELTMLSVVTLATGACGTGSADDERAAAVYAAVIRTVANEGPGEFHPDDGYDERVVYAGPLDEEVEIPLEVQATVVEQLHDENFATIRFVDERREALHPQSERERVLEDGVLVLVSEVPEDGDALQVATQRYVDADTVAHFTAHAVASDDEWEIARLEPLAP